MRHGWAVSWCMLSRITSSSSSATTAPTASHAFPALAVISALTCVMDRAYSANAMVQTLVMATRSVVTFLFTDIEGSTRMWEDHPDAMEVALARHDALLRRAIEGWRRGRLQDGRRRVLCRVRRRVRLRPRRGRGDNSRCKRSRGRHPSTIRARMAIHTGECTRRDDDFFGPTVNRVARLLAIGHGGQVLVSASARLALGEHVPPGVGAPRPG